MKNLLILLATFFTIQLHAQDHRGELSIGANSVNASEIAWRHNAVCTPSRSHIVFSEAYIQEYRAMNAEVYELDKVTYDYLLSAINSLVSQGHLSMSNRDLIAQNLNHPDYIVADVFTSPAGVQVRKDFHIAQSKRQPKTVATNAALLRR